MSKLIAFATPCIRSLPALEWWMAYLVAVLAWWKISFKFFSLVLKLIRNKLIAA
jgi:hypothetical protein